MDKSFAITVLFGGVGPEREVSLASGRAIAEALAKRFQVTLLELDEAALPASLDAGSGVVFPALHGTFGEDGALQAMLDQRGIVYCGSGETASRLCIDKTATKRVAAQQGVAVADAIDFSAGQKPEAAAVLAHLGSDLVIKPANQGSSVGLAFADSEAGLAEVLEGIGSGEWMIERRIRGRELTVGVLDGEAMGIVEILSRKGVYDYATKYTPGASRYVYPSALADGLAAGIRSAAERVFSACGCRDFARMDFILKDGTAFLLEVNTLPGLTATSLLPKSAACVGLDFEALAERLVRPAIARFTD